MLLFFFFQAEDGIRDYKVTGVQTCALPIYFLVHQLKQYTSLPCQLGTDEQQIKKGHIYIAIPNFHLLRSEERRVGKECRSSGSKYHKKQKEKKKTQVNEDNK